MNTEKMKKDIVEFVNKMKARYGEDINNIDISGLILSNKSTETDSKYLTYAVRKYRNEDITVCFEEIISD